MVIVGMGEEAMGIAVTTGIAIFILLFSQTTECLSMPKNSVSSDDNSVHQKIYQFQHRLLPKWTHESKGLFFEDMMKGNTSRLIEAAEKIVGEDFSKKVEIRRFHNSRGVLLIFPTPNEPPECFYIYIVKAKDGFHFYTYEKTKDLFKDGDKGVVGEWTADGTHNNLGSRKYDDVDSFVTEIQKFQ